MSKRKIFLLVLAVFSLLLLACDLGTAASTSTGDEDLRAIVFLDTLQRTMETGAVVRGGLTETLSNYLAGKVTQSVLVKTARNTRDWHQKALKEMEVVTNRAPADFRRMGQLYSVKRLPPASVLGAPQATRQENWLV